MGKLDGKVAIVTGAGQGVGEGIALALAGEGACVAAAGRTLSKVQRTADRISASGGRALALGCDVTVATDIEATVAETVEQFGPVDILVNNAQSAADGAAGQSPLDTLDVDEVLAFFHGGAISSLVTMQACFPHMKERGGSIVNLASATGVTGEAGFGAYAMAKEAIRGLTKVAAREWGGHGITVNVVCPTALSPAAVQFRTDSPDRFSQFLDQIPLGRMGDCELDIGRAVAALVGPDMRFVTGATLMIDGGKCILR